MSEETTTAPSGPLFTEPPPGEPAKAEEKVPDPQETKAEPVKEVAPVAQAKPATKPKPAKKVEPKKVEAKPAPAPAKAKPAPAAKKPVKRKPAKSAKKRGPGRPKAKSKGEARSGVAISASTHRKVIRLQAKLKAKTGERVSLSDTIDRAVSKLL